MNLKRQFPMFKNNPNLIYFDNAATTFKPYEVIEAVNSYYEKYTSNIHRGDYDLSFQISDLYEKTREKVAKFINAKDKNEIVFTSGASESLNLVAYGYGQKFLKEGDIIITSEAEHASNILPWFKVAEVTKAKILYVPLDEQGRFKLEEFKKMLNSNVKVVSLAYVSNVLGYVLPIKEICKLAHEVGAIVNVDGAQSIAHLVTDVQDLDLDFLSFSAHKMYGPSGVGVLYGKKNILEMTDPFMLGGGSNARFDICGNILLKNAPYKFEAGTPNIEGVVGLGAAIDFLNKNDYGKLFLNEKELTKYFIENLKKLDNVIIYNPNVDSSIVTFNCKGVFAQDVASYLNSKGIAVRSGNHCAKVLVEVLNVSETVRASIGIYNTKEEIDYFLEVIKNANLENCVGALL